MKKEYTKEDVLSILDFAKSKTDESKDVLLKWKVDKSNRVEKEDEHGLSVVGIFEHPLTNKEGKEVGKIIVFNYTGVGGGWENDIFNMVEKKYFSESEKYNFFPGEGDSFCHRLFITGDVFSDEIFEQWEKPKGSDEFRVFKQVLPNSEFIIWYDVSDEGDGIEMRNELESRRSDYSFYWDNSACMYYIKNITELDFKPARPIIEERINSRKNETK